MKATALHLNGRLQETVIRQLHILSAATALGLSALTLFLGGCASRTESTIAVGTQNIAMQQFNVDADKGGVVVGKQGAIFAIPAGAFTDDMGNSIHGNVQLQVKEANRDVDILVGGLVTRAGNDMLASGGMYMIEARANGKSIKVNPAVGIYAYLPTQKKDLSMGLYKGEFNQSKLDWKLTGQGEQAVPECDRDKASRAKCKKCERLVKMVSKIKPGKKPDPNKEYWAKRHYWENGKLYFYSSGSKQKLLSEDEIEECKSYLQASENGRELLGLVDQYKAEWKDRIGEYYSYKLDGLGWYNIDKVVKEDLMTFSGRIIDHDGQPVAGAKVHLYCKDADLKVHTQTTAEDGSYKLEFAKGRSFLLFAYEKGRLGKQQVTLRNPAQDMGDLGITQINPQSAEGFLDEVM